MINVGIVSENEEGILAVKRGSKLALKVGKDFGSEQVLVIAIKKHSDHDQFFSGEEEYVLLYPDQKVVNKVPGSNDDFTVAKYKQELAKSYSKCGLYLCKVNEFVQNRGPEAEKEKETKIILKSEPKEQKQAVVNLVDVPSDDDSFLEHSLFDDSLMYFDDFHHFPGNTCTLQCGNTPTTSGPPGLNLFTSQSM